jgi:hypothetical protein
MAWTSSKSLTVGLAALALLALTPFSARAQATSRTCSGQAGETPGPACLVAHQDLGALPKEPLYWNIYRFADVQAAERVKPPRGAVVEAFSQVWLFDVETRRGFALILHGEGHPPTTLTSSWAPKGLCPKGGRRSSQVGRP